MRKFLVALCVVSVFAVFAAPVSAHKSPRVDRLQDRVEKLRDRNASLRDGKRVLRAERDEYRHTVNAVAFLIQFSFKRPIEENVELGNAEVIQFLHAVEAAATQ